jgi:hypothetical protein
MAHREKESLSGICYWLFVKETKNGEELGGWDSLPLRGSGAHSA